MLDDEDCDNDEPAMEEGTRQYVSSSTMIDKSDGAAVEFKQAKSSCEDLGSKSEEEDTGAATATGRMRERGLLSFFFSVDVERASANMRRCSDFPVWGVFCPIKVAVTPVLGGCRPPLAA